MACDGRLIVKNWKEENHDKLGVRVGKEAKRAISHFGPENVGRTYLSAYYREEPECECRDHL